MDGKKHIDHVCGMNVEPTTAAGQTEYQGQTYYFCSESCRKKFEANPQAYLHKPQPALTSLSVMGKPVKLNPQSSQHEAGLQSAAESSLHSVEHHQNEYTCPMDLEIRQ